MNFKCIAVSAVFALTFGGSYCAETNAVVNEVKNDGTQSA